ncbi:MAG: hypothetical protein JSS91_08920 [Bacteroidetes bacterium]|nr:hypothetical protein [Bacteroidota bacterium]
MKKYISAKIVSAFLILVFSAVNAVSQEKSAEDLAKSLSNPVASLISVPFQNNFQFGIGQEHGYKYLLNFQPVIPVSISSGLNLINRVIVPAVFQNDVILNSRQNGIGDILYTGFISPKVSKVTWGLGPALSIPTATDDLLGSKKVLLGPSLVVLAQPGSWTVGGLVNNLWSVAGSSERGEITAFFGQPFITYNTKGGMGIGVSSENSYDWRGKRLTSGLVAINLTQVIKFDGKQNASVAFAPLLYYANQNVNRPEWGARVSITLVYPK